MKQPELFSTADFGGDLRGVCNVQPMDIPALERECETDDDRLLVRILADCKRHGVRQIHFI